MKGSLMVLQFNSSKNPCTGGFAADALELGMKQKYRDLFLKFIAPILRIYQMQVRQSLNRALI
jgi:hypothetical protein